LLRSLSALVLWVCKKKKKKEEEKEEGCGACYNGGRGKAAAIYAPSPDAFRIAHCNLPFHWHDFISSPLNFGISLFKPSLRLARSAQSWDVQAYGCRLHIRAMTAPVQWASTGVGFNLSHILRFSTTLLVCQGEAPALWPATGQSVTEQPLNRYQRTPGRGWLVHYWRPVKAKFTVVIPLLPNISAAHFAPVARAGQDVPCSPDRRYAAGSSTAYGTQA
jgi:hypothetical protein